MEIVFISSKGLNRDSKKHHIIFYEAILEDIGEAYCLNGQMDKIKVCEGTETAPHTVKVPIFFLDSARVKQFDQYWRRFQDSTKFEVLDGPEKGHVGYFRYR